MLQRLVTKTASDEAIVVIRGDFDAAFSAAVREAIVAAQETHERVVVDLSETAFIDSSGLGVIAAAAGRAAKTGAAFGLARPSPSVARTLQMFGLDALVLDGSP